MTCSARQRPGRGVVILLGHGLPGPGRTAVLRVSRDLRATPGGTVGGTTGGASGGHRHRPRRGGSGRRAGADPGSAVCQLVDRGGKIGVRPRFAVHPAPARYARARRGHRRRGPGAGPGVHAARRSRADRADRGARRRSPRPPGDRGRGQGHAGRRHRGVRQRARRCDGPGDRARQPPAPGAARGLPGGAVHARAHRGAGGRGHGRQPDHAARVRARAPGLRRAPRASLPGDLCTAGPDVHRCRRRRVLSARSRRHHRGRRRHQHQDRLDLPGRQSDHREMGYVLCQNI